MSDHDDPSASTIAAAADALIEMAPALCGVAIADAFRPGVRVHLINSLTIARTITQGGIENAPVFKP